MGSLSFALYTSSALLCRTASANPLSLTPANPIADFGRRTWPDCKFHCQRITAFSSSTGQRIGAGCDSDSDSHRTESGYLGLSDEQLMSQCEMETFKASGPGGQHRNKRETAVRLKHLPTGIIAQVLLHCCVFKSLI